MTTPDAIRAIGEATKRFGKAALIGVGTVLDETTCRKAAEAGAEFVVTPIVRPAIAEVAHEYGCVAMLELATPTEAQLGLRGWMRIS